MKRLSILAAAALTLTACTKDVSNVATKSAHAYNPALAAKHTTTAFEPNTAPLADVAKGYDSTDSRLRRLRLYLSVGLTEVVKDSTIAAWITDQAARTEDKSILFSELFAQFPEAKQIIESATDPLGQISGQSFETLEAQMMGGGAEYNAEIYLPNAASADKEYTPIVTPGLDIEDDTVRHLDDIALAWQIGSNNVVSQIRIWEELANQIPAPVLAVSMRPKPNFLSPTPGQSEKGTGSTDLLNNTMIIDHYQINSHYDNSNNNEYCITGCWKNAGGLVQKYLRYTCMGGTISGQVQHADHYTKLADVPKSDVGKTKQCGKFFCKVSSAGEYDQNKKVYFNTFERDWFAGAKNLGVMNWNGLFYMKGNMTNAYEWYQYSPTNSAFTSYNRVDVYGIQNNVAGGQQWTYTSDNGKGHVNLKVVTGCY